MTKKNTEFRRKESDVFKVDHGKLRMENSSCPCWDSITGVNYSTFFARIISYPFDEIRPFGENLLLRNQLPPIQSKHSFKQNIRAAGHVFGACVFVR